MGPRPGGWASGLANQPDGGCGWFVFPAGENPVRASIPVFLWTEAVLHGRGMGAEHGVQGAERLESDIKLIYAVATNCLVNQYSNDSSPRLPSESTSSARVHQATGPLEGNLPNPR